MPILWLHVGPPGSGLFLTLGVEVSLRGVWGGYIISFLLLNSRIFDLSSRFWDDMVIILSRRIICIYDYSGWAGVMEEHIYRIGTYIHTFANLIRLHVAFREFTRVFVV